MFVSLRVGDNGYSSSVNGYDGPSEQNVTAMDDLTVTLRGGASTCAQLPTDLR
jgi:hypothetical protein